MSDDIESVEVPDDAMEPVSDVPVQIDAVSAEEPEATSEPEVVPEAAPEPEATPEPEAVEPFAEAPAYSVSWVPFSAYLGLWIVFAVATFTVLRANAAGGVLWIPEYAFSVYGGIVLVVLGPVLGLVVWLFARRGAGPEHRRGLLASALLRAAGATFVGAILWLVALYALDLYRAGFHA